MTDARESGTTEYSPGLYEAIGEFIWKNGLDSFGLAFRPHADEWVASGTTSNGRRVEGRGPGVKSALRDFEGSLHDFRQVAL